MQTQNLLETLRKLDAQNKRVYLTLSKTTTPEQAQKVLNSHGVMVIVTSRGINILQAIIESERPSSYIVPIEFRSRVTAWNTYAEILAPFVESAEFQG